MDLHNYQPGRRLVLAAPRYNDPFCVSHALRAMLLWPLLPYWLVYLGVVALRRQLRLDKPLWLRTVDFDGDRKQLRVRFGLWPLFIMGRKTIAFADLQSLDFRMVDRPNGGVDLSCDAKHRGGTLHFTVELTTVFDRTAAMGLVKRMARIVGWRQCTLQVDAAQPHTAPYRTAQHEREVTQLRLLPERDTNAGGEPVSLPKRPRLDGPRKERRKASRARPTSTELETLQRACSWRVAGWHAGESIELSKPWDLRAFIGSVFIVLPLSPVAAGFLLVGITALLMFPPLLLDVLSPVTIPEDVLLALAAASLAAGMVAMLVDVVRGILREYGSRRVRIDWDSRTISVTGPGQQVAVAFEDVKAVVVREPWEGEVPENVGYDVRPAIEIERRGASAPLRLVWFPYTRGHEPDDLGALDAVARATARALGVPHRKSGFQELQTR